MEIYSKSKAYIRSFRAGIGSQVGVVPFEASLHAPGLGGGVGWGAVQHHLHAAAHQHGREAREEVRRALLDGLAGVHGQAPGQLLDLVDRQPPRDSATMEMKAMLASLHRSQAPAIFLL